MQHAEIKEVEIERQCLTREEYFISNLFIQNLFFCYIKCIQKVHAEVKGFLRIARSFMLLCFNYLVSGSQIHLVLGIYVNRWFFIIFVTIFKKPKSCCIA